eukprot:TRINITY_DN33829_c0_g1_i1.p1 TRINITY_DN33829_c0_g1~~TRINITY_DN33829_c0_g1_i1.p1  ORF type:complete len:1138 (+),score=183.01 TRINITY_DN33829_c0_g1_i1:208-3414(+)
MAAVTDEFLPYLRKAGAADYDLAFLPSLLVEICRARSAPDFWAAARLPLSEAVPSLPTALAAAQVAGAYASAMEPARKSSDGAEHNVNAKRTKAYRFASATEVSALARPLWQSLVVRLTRGDASLADLHVAAVAFVRARVADPVLFRHIALRLRDAVVAADHAAGISTLSQEPVPEMMREADAQQQEQDVASIGKKAAAEVNTVGAVAGDAIDANALSQLAFAFRSIGAELPGDVTDTFWSAFTRGLALHGRLSVVWDQYLPRHLPNLAVGLIEKTAQRQHDHPAAVAALAGLVLDGGGVRLHGLNNRGLALVTRLFSSLSGTTGAALTTAAAEPDTGLTGVAGVTRPDDCSALVLAEVRRRANSEKSLPLSDVAVLLNALSHGGVRVHRPVDGSCEYGESDSRGPRGGASALVNREADAATRVVGYDVASIPPMEGTQATSSPEPPVYSTAYALADVLAQRLRAGEHAAPRDVANALDVLGRLGCCHEALLSVAAGYVPDAVHDFGPRDVVGIAVALGRLRQRDEPTFITLSDHICQDIGRFSFTQLADLATAYARLRVREVRFLQRLLEQCGTLTARNSLQPREAVALLSAWGRLHVSHAEAFEVTGDVIAASLSNPENVRRLLTSPNGEDCTETERLHAELGLSQTDLREVALAYARARWTHWALLGLIADGCASVQASTVPLEVVCTVLCAMCRLRWQHAALQRMVLTAFLAADEQLVDGDGGASPPLSVQLWSQAIHAATVLDMPHQSRVDAELWRRCCNIVVLRLRRLHGVQSRSEMEQEELALQNQQYQQGCEEIQSGEAPPVSRSVGVSMPTWTEAYQTAEANLDDVGDDSLLSETGLSTYTRELCFGAIASNVLAVVLGCEGGKSLESEKLIVSDVDRSEALVGLLGWPPTASSGILAHALALHHIGAMTSRPGFEGLHLPLLEACELAGLGNTDVADDVDGSIGADGSYDVIDGCMSGAISGTEEAGTVVGASAAETTLELDRRHEPGLRGRELTKEAHEVSKILKRIGGHAAPDPLRQPWIVKPALLGVNLLLPCDWRPDDSDFAGSTVESTSRHAV